MTLDNFRHQLQQLYIVYQYTEYQHIFFKEGKVNFEVTFNEEFNTDLYFNLDDDLLD